MIKDMLKKVDLSELENAAPISNEKMREHLLKSIEDCGCICHRQSGVMHCFPCCDACCMSADDVYRQYPV